MFQGYKTTNVHDNFSFLSNELFPFQTKKTDTFNEIREILLESSPVLKSLLVAMIYREISIQYR